MKLLNFYSCAIKRLNVYSMCHKTAKPLIFNSYAIKRLKFHCMCHKTAKLLNFSNVCHKTLIKLSACTNITASLIAYRHSAS